LLEAHPELLADQSLQVDLAYEEFCQRKAAGEPVDVEEYCERYPWCKTALRRIIDLASAFEDRAGSILAEFETRKPIDWPVEGTTFLDFELVHRLGSGAFSRVYLALEKRLGHRFVVVKITDDTFHEELVLGRLQHANIVPVNSVQTDPATKLTALCMPYLGSATLIDVIDHCHGGAQKAAAASAILEAASKGVPPEAEETGVFPARATFVEGAVHLAAQLADALAFVHAKSIYHRDLKPSNVLVSPSGRPRLLDFNLSFSALTPRRFVGGTVAYMSPEQIRATVYKDGKPADLDARADIFSLGVVLYELLAGRHPYGTLPRSLKPEALGEVMLERQGRGAAPLRTVCPEADAGLERVVMRCLAVEPAQRPSSAAELARELRALLRPAQRVQRRARRHPVLVAVFFLATLLTVGGVAAILARAPRHYDRGLEAYRAGAYGQAVEQFTQARVSGHDAGQALFARGRAHQQLGEFAEALEDYKQAALHKGGDVRIVACRAYCLNRLKHHAMAAQHYQEVTGGGYTTAAILNNLAYSCLQQSNLDWELAKRSLDRAIHLEPRLQAAYYNRALWHYQTVLAQRGGDVRPACADMHKALALGPPSAELCFDAAHCFALERRDDDALDCLRQALELGQDPQAIGKDKSFAPLHGDPRFGALVKRPRAAPAPTRTLRVLDPLDAIPVLN
jgi:serine/threonine protein kinase/Flp pilus assembly protein TadD